MKVRTNGELRGTPLVQVVDEHDLPRGTMALSMALRIALAERLDLVEVDGGAEPPLCKLVRRSESRRDARHDVTPLPTPPSEPLGEAPGVELPPETMVAWSPFDCDGRALEYLAVPTRTMSRPIDWPAHEPFPGQWFPVILVAVRERGARSNETGAASVGLILPEGTVVTLEHALRAARLSPR